MKKKSLLATAAAILIGSMLLTGCGETVTFMYFVSGSDAEYEETNAMLEELQEEYGKKVVFDIVNIDENPEAKENFPVDGNTPALFMLNTDNDLSAIELQCNDKDTLIADIEAAFN